VEIIIPKENPSTIEMMQRPLELDLMAYFKSLEDKMLQMVEEGKEPEEIIKEIEELLDG